MYVQWMEDIWDQRTSWSYKRAGWEKAAEAQKRDVIVGGACIKGKGIKITEDIRSTISLQQTNKKDNPFRGI